VPAAFRQNKLFKRGTNALPSRQGIFLRKLTQEKAGVSFYKKKFGSARTKQQREVVERWLRKNFIGRSNRPFKP
jgi:hypothetical protein